MTKKKDLRCYPDLTLTISKFMSTFYNIKEKKLNKLTHKDLKNIFPGLKTVSNENISQEQLRTGAIILVIDINNIVLGYINPYINDYYEKHSYECQDNSKIHVIFTIDDDIETINEEDLNNLSTYELEQLLKKAKKHQKLKEQRLVQKELYFEKDNHSTKKEKQEKVRIREIRKEDL